MAKDEEMAVNWIRSQGWSEENLPSDELLQMETAFLAGLKAGKDMAEADLATVAYMQGAERHKPKWHKLDWEKDYPDVDKLIRVRTYSGEEYICESYSYKPTEDEIGYGHFITQFSELNGDWVDDNEVEYWCEIPKYTEE